MKTVAVVAMLLVSCALCLAQPDRGGLDSLKATPEEIAPLKVVLDELWAKAQAQDTTGVTSLLHEKSAFWQMQGPGSGKLIHRDTLAELLIANPMPAGVTLGEAKAWIGENVALVGAPVVGLPAEATGGRAVVLGALMVQTAGRWQVVTADLLDPELEQPTFEGDNPEESTAMQAAFREFQQAMMARGASFLLESLEDEGVVVAWSDDEYRLIVTSPKELRWMLDQVAGLTLAPAADPQYFAVYGSGVAVMAATVDINAMGVSLQRRLILCSGYQPETGKWRLYAVAAVPNPE